MKKTTKLFTVILSILIVSSSFFSSVIFAATTYNCKKGIHDYKVTITTPVTKNKDGKRLYKCILCGYSYSEAIPKTGHSWGNWKTEKLGTCAVKGREYRVCNRHDGSPHYDYRSTSLNSENHNFVKTKTTPATCEKTGSTIYTCSGCGEKKIKETKALGHKYSDWIIEKEATDYDTGLRYKICKNNSNHKREEVIPMTASATGNDDYNNSSLNNLDYILLTVNATIFTSFFFLIKYDYLVIAWHKRKKKDFADKEGM